MEKSKSRLDLYATLSALIGDVSLFAGLLLALGNMERYWQPGVLIILFGIGWILNSIALRLTIAQLPD